MFSRISCHYCNARQPYDKSVREFRCSNCESHNFFDGKGTVMDPPATVTWSTAAAHGSRSSSAARRRPNMDTLQHGTEQPFCRTCTQNQLIYNETLSNYLPDEDHPTYRQMVKELPKFKRDLERRYPLICTACAAKAQLKINRADYYALTNNAALRCNETRARGRRIPHGIRDSWGKYGMRAILNLVGFAAYGSLFTQLIYHTYGIVLIVFANAAAARSSPESVHSGSLLTEFAFDPSLADCAKNSLSGLVDSACYRQLEVLVKGALVVALGLIWYNPGLKLWYHPTFRMEAVTGQRDYFLMQMLSLVIRVWAWHSLRDLTQVNENNSDQALAMHGFVVFYTLVTQTIAARNIRGRRWSIKGHVMPKPEEKNVLGVGAGPVKDHFTPKVSNADPFRLLRSGDSLHTGSDLRGKQKQPPLPHDYPQLKLTIGGPTPEDSLPEDNDEMDIDDDDTTTSSYQPKPQARMEARNVYFRNPNKPLLAVGDLAQELSNVQRQMTAEDQHRAAAAASKYRYNPTNNLHPGQQRPTFSLPPQRPFNAPPPRPDYMANPFQGTLPPAPMSMERRLRNPPFQPPPPAKVVSPTTRPGWFAGLANSVAPPVQPTTFRHGSDAEVAKGKWVLPQDVQRLPEGLEERFDQVFRLDDTQHARHGSKDADSWFARMFG